MSSKKASSRGDGGGSSHTSQARVKGKGKVHGSSSSRGALNLVQRTIQHFLPRSILKGPADQRTEQRNEHDDQSLSEGNDGSGDEVAMTPKKVAHRQARSSESANHSDTGTASASPASSSKQHHGTNSTKKTKHTHAHMTSTSNGHSKLASRHSSPASSPRHKPSHSAAHQSKQLSHKMRDDHHHPPSAIKQKKGKPTNQHHATAAKKRDATSHQADGVDSDDGNDAVADDSEDEEAVDDGGMDDDEWMPSSSSHEDSDSDVSNFSSDHSSLPHSQRRRGRSSTHASSTLKSVRKRTTRSQISRQHSDDEDDESQMEDEDEDEDSSYDDDQDDSSSARQRHKNNRSAHKKAKAHQQHNNNHTPSSSSSPIAHQKSEPESDSSPNSLNSTPTHTHHTSSTNSNKKKPIKRKLHEITSAASENHEDDDIGDDEAPERSVAPPLLPTSSLLSPPSSLSLPATSPAPPELDDECRPSRIRLITHVQYGDYELVTWYPSPYPDPYRTSKKLFVCRYCLKYCKEIRTIAQHMKECKCRRPPGKLIYQDGKNAVFEVDGSIHKLYCQCLCLFAKLFIDHKTLYYDVDPFHFYVLTEIVPIKSSTTSATAPSTSPSSSSAASSTSPSASSSSSSSHPTPNESNSSSSSSSSSFDSAASYHEVVAYFSKEKNSPDHYNLSCIVTLPHHQRKGYGRFLIALSYELSRREGRVGSPEKPLSELGRLSYISYWVGELMQLFATDPTTRNLSIIDLCARTGFKKEDVISALESVGFIRHVSGEHELNVDSKVVAEYQSKATAALESAKAKGVLTLKPDLLKWRLPPAASNQRFEAPDYASLPPLLASPIKSKPTSAKKTGSHRKKIKY